MMGHRKVEKAALFYEFSLEAYIPTLRSIDRFGELRRSYPPSTAQLAGHRSTPSCGFAGLYRRLRSRKLDDQEGLGQVRRLAGGHRHPHQCKCGACCSLHATQDQPCAGRVQDAALTRYATAGWSGVALKAWGMALAA